MSGVKGLNHIHLTSQQFIYDQNLEKYSLEIFLLDNENRVFLVGDPTEDLLIKKFYKNL